MGGLALCGGRISSGALRLTYSTRHVVVQRYQCLIMESAYFGALNIISGSTIVTELVKSLFTFERSCRRLVWRIVSVAYCNYNSLLLFVAVVS